MARNISSLNSQIIINSGNIVDPNNSKAIVRNSERVRNDLLNISEYINGMVYYLFKSLPDGTLYPQDAAEEGLSGNTLVANPSATSSFSDVFWFSSSVNGGRAKTVTEAIESLQAKLLQQQVNISVLQSIDITQLTSMVNSSAESVAQVRRNVFGSAFGSASNDLEFPIKEYVFQLYKTLFNTEFLELNDNSTEFPSLTANIPIAQSLIPGCGSYASLEDELSAIKLILNNNSCDPDFVLSWPVATFPIAPATSDIKTSLTTIIGKLSEALVETSLNATSITGLTDEVALLTGTSLASDSVAGIVEEATSAEVLMGTEVSGSNRLYLNPKTFCDTIFNNTQADFLAQANSFGRAWVQATKYCINSGEITLPSGSSSEYEHYVNIARTNSPIGSFQAEENRHYSTDTENGIVTFTLDLGSVSNGDLFRFKNITSSGTIILKTPATFGYTIEGVNSYNVTGPYACITLMVDTHSSTLQVISKYG